MWISVHVEWVLQYSVYTGLIHLLFKYILDNNMRVVTFFQNKGI